MLVAPRELRVIRVLLCWARGFVRRRAGVGAQVGLEMDTFCLINKAWYQSKVAKVDPAGGRVLVHFKGWGKSADEWMATDSDRLRPNKLHTCAADYKAELALLLKGDAHHGRSHGDTRRRSSSSSSSSSGGSGRGRGSSGNKRPRSAAGDKSKSAAAAAAKAPRQAAKRKGEAARAEGPPPEAAAGGAAPANRRCEACQSAMDGSYGSGRFCNQACRSKWNGSQGRAPSPQKAGGGNMGD